MIKRHIGGEWKPLYTKTAAAEVADLFTTVVPFSRAKDEGRYIELDFRATHTLLLPFHIVYTIPVEEWELFNREVKRYLRERRGEDWRQATAHEAWLKMILELKKGGDRGHTDPAGSVA